MGFLNRAHFDSLEDLFIDQVQDLYDAEKRLINALPKMADAARSGELRQAFRAHLAETRQHAVRLEQIFQMFGLRPERETCDGMKGLIKEGEEMVEATGNDSVRDAALIAAAQRVEHYEIAGYGTARSLARQLGREEAARLLQTTLNEEGEADQKLTALAEQFVNAEAVHG